MSKSRKNTPVAAAPAPAGTAYAPLGVRRRTVGLQRHATVGIRAAALAILAASGAEGAIVGGPVNVNGETKHEPGLIDAWRHNGTAAKVAECMGIMAGDEYGYPIERLPHPVNRTFDRYRLTPGVAIPAPATTAPDTTNPPPAVTAKPTKATKATKATSAKAKAKATPPAAPAGDTPA